MIVRGLYSDWSVVLQSAKYVNFDVAASLIRRLNSMASTGANLLWWTNLPDDVAQLTTIVRECRTRGIECVLGSGRWYAYAGRGAEQVTRLQSLHNALPPDARPLAWSIGDETAPDAYSDLRHIATTCAAAGIPATMVQIPERHADTVAAVGSSLPWMSCDVYPFFVPGLPSNPPYGLAALTRARSQYTAAVSRISTVIMSQGFSDPTLFATPTPAQARWQIWASIASGSNGAIVFAHGLPEQISGQSLVNLVAETETPQGAAVRDTFARMVALDGLQFTTTEAAPAWQTTQASGDVAAIRRTTDGRRVLIVVADPDQPRRTIKVTLPSVLKITQTASSSGGSLSVLPWPWYILFPPTFSVSLNPGDAWLGELN